MPPVLSDPLVGWADGPGTRSTPPTSTRSDPRPENPRSSKPRSKSALEALLVDLGPQIRQGTAAEPSQVCATGLTALDARLGGGFPRGRLSEICGPPSSGRTALALKLVDTTLREGGLTGWIDLADAFDPRSASASGVALERLLWVRPRSESEALKSCDRLLQTQGFELIVFDCVGPTTGSRKGPRNAAPNPSISDVSWLRLARLAAKTPTALVVLSQARGSRAASGSQSALLLEMLPMGARFVGAPHLLESLETTAILRRHRTRPSGAEIPLSAQIEPER